MSNFNKVGLISKSNDLSVSETLNKVYNLLQEKGLDVMLETSTRGLLGGPITVDIETIGQQCDLAVVIGGDGTLLRAARELVNADVPLIGVNRGRLGFLVDVSPEDGLHELVDIIDGNYQQEERLMLNCRLARHGEIIHQSLAFNDMVMRTKNVLQIIEFEISINGSFVLSQRADGVIVASPSGSTAYSVTEKKTVHAQMVCDGQVYNDLQNDDIIEVRRHDKAIRILHPANYDYHSILREKLNWG